MIINKTMVSFAGRTPSPRYIPVAVKGDNCVECVEFRLPSIDDEQTATLLNGRYADAITLKREGDLYCLDVTADIAGAPGRIEAYIRINGTSGAVWNSEPFVLCICDVPDIGKEIEEHNPTAFDKMLEAMAEHYGYMNETLAEAKTSEKAAEDSAARAATSANAADSAASLACQFCNDAESAANEAADSEKAAEEGAARSEAAANRAEQAAATNGYVFFEINDAGRLIMTKTENVENLDFRLSDGRLEAVYG